MNNTAKLVKAFVQCSGITDARKISALTGVAVATIYRALNDIKLNALMDGNIPVGENENIPVGENETCSPSRAHKLPEEIKKTPIVPKLELEPPPADKPKAARKLADMVGFDDWYSIYPKKTGKAAAEKAWPKAVQRAGSPEPIIEALKKQLPSLKTKERQYIKDPSTWLNKACWEDEIGLKNGYTPSDFEGKSRSEIMRMMRAH